MNVVDADEASVGAGIEPSLGVHGEAEIVVPALGEELEDLFPGMVAPDGLSLEVEPRPLLAGLADGGRGGASRAAVKPAVRSPEQAVGDGVEVLQAEAFQVHRRGTVGHVVPIRVRVEEQIRGIQHPDAAAPGQCRAADVQSSDEVLLSLVAAVAVPVFQDGDPVPARDMTGWRRGRKAVVLDAPEAVMGNDLQAGGEGKLEILNHPDPPPFVEGHVQRLPDLRLGGDGVQLKRGRQGELQVGVVDARVRRQMAGQAQHGPDHNQEEVS